MARRHGKRDANQGAVRDMARAMGASVTSLDDVGDGVPDLLVGYRGVTMLWEVKGPRGKLNPGQAEWHDAWRGSPVLVVRGPEDVQRILADVAESSRRRWLQLLGEELAGTCQ